jgi:5-methylcytosine-specific restriction endonuclease McrA
MAWNGGTTEKYFCGRACRRNGETRSCGLCGALFYLNSTDLRNPARKGRWCSRECTDIGRKRGITQSCKTCEKIFYAFPSRRKNGAGRYCSVECFAPRRSEIHAGKAVGQETRAKLSASRTGLEVPAARGANHPNWRGGGSHAYGPNWVSKRSQTRRRDAYTCQDCGLRETNRAHDVHHLVPLRSFDGDYETANRLDNLVTLCHPCHMAREVVLGYKLRPTTTVQIPRSV